MIMEPSFPGIRMERPVTKASVREHHHHQHHHPRSSNCWLKSDAACRSRRQDATRRGDQTALRDWLPCLIPPVLAVGVYCNSLDGDFVHDDLSAITGNRDITDPTVGTWDFLYNDFWGTSMLDPRSHKSYRPLTILTFKWNYALSGLNPWSYHVVNVLLHATVCYLFAWLCRNCFHLSRLSSLLAASLFALHPIHTEAVSGIVGRADVLATMFFLLSFICHDRATIDNSTKSSFPAGSSHPSTCFTALILRVASLLLALAALAAKENGIAVLPVAITWDIIRLHQRSSGSCGETKHKSHIAACKAGSSHIRLPSRATNRWRRYRSWFGSVFRSWPILLSILTTIILLVARIGLQQGQLPLFSEQDNPAAFASSRKARILTLLYLPAFNMGLLLAPVFLSYDWQNGSIPLVEDWRDWRNVGTLVFYMSLVAVLIFSWLNRKNVILWSAAVMVWPMLPASNLFYPCGFVVAERLLYLPSLGYCLIVAVGLRVVFRSTFSRWTHLRSARPIFQYRPPGSYASLRRRSSSSSSSSSSFSSSSSSSTLSSVSTSYNQIPIWKLFVDCLPVAAIVLLSITFASKTWTRNADWADRRTLFESGLRTLPNNAKMHYNYANVQKDDGRWDVAIDHYRQAIELWPNYASALNNLGTVLLARADEMDDSDRLKESTVLEAEHRFLDAIRSHPHHAHAHYNLAVLNLQRNETRQAFNLLRRCLHLNPQHREALHLLQWLQVEHQVGSSNGFDEFSVTSGVTASASPSSRNHNAAGTRQPAAYFRNGEKAATISSYSTTHPGSPKTMSTPPRDGYWTANRLETHQQQQPQREESIQHRANGGGTNFRWNKTAKN